MNAYTILNNVIDKLKLNAVIPKLHQASLKQTADTISLNDMSAEDGWCLYSDQFKNGRKDNDKSNILEGEWYTKNQTTTIQLQNNHHLIMTMTSDKKGDEHLYQKQEISNKDQGKSIYKIWWHCNDKGKYQPFAQQYFGKQSTGEKS